MDTHRQVEARSKFNDTAADMARDCGNIGVARLLEDIAKERAGYPKGLRSYAKDAEGAQHRGLPYGGRNGHSRDATMQSSDRKRTWDGDGDGHGDRDGDGWGSSKGQYGGGKHGKFYEGERAAGFLDRRNAARWQASTAGGDAGFNTYTAQHGGNTFGANMSMPAEGTQRQAHTQSVQRQVYHEYMQKQAAELMQQQQRDHSSSANTLPGDGGSFNANMQGQHVGAMPTGWMAGSTNAAHNPAAHR
jgi:hypothetical protein